MKKIYFGLLMISAMFMVASCGSKSNSGEAPAEEKEVTFTDPALSYSEGLDLTSYFSAESLTQPGIFKDEERYRLTTTIKLKLQKELNLERTSEYFNGDFIFKIIFCDKNGSKITDTYNIDRDFSKMNVGTIITLEGKSREYSALESEMQKKLDKVEKIEVFIGTERLKFAETAESNE